MKNKISCPFCNQELECFTIELPNTNKSYNFNDTCDCASKFLIRFVHQENKIISYTISFLINENDSLLEIIARKEENITTLNYYPNKNSKIFNFYIELNIHDINKFIKKLFNLLIFI